MSGHRSTSGTRVYYGWWIVGAGFSMAMLIGGFINYGFTALVEPVAAELGWSYAEVSFAASLRGLEVGLFAPFLGFLVDRRGARQLMVVGGILVGLGLVLLGQVSSLLTFYGAFLLIGAGTSACLGVVPVTAINQWFRSKATVATGVLLSGIAVGGLLVPVATRLIDGLGWRTAATLMGVLAWAVLLPMAFVFRRRPEGYGLRPDSAPEVRAIDGTGSCDGVAGTQGHQGLRALRTRRFWHVSVAIMIHMLVMSAIMTHVMPYLATVGTARTTASLVASAIPLVSIAGRLGFGWLGDRFDKRRVTSLGLALTGVGLVLFAAASTGRGWLFIPFLITIGVGYGGPVPMLPALTREYFGRARFGSVLGLAFGASTVGSMLGPPLAGWAYDRGGSYQSVWLALAALLAVGILALLTAPVRMADAEDVAAAALLRDAEVRIV